MDKFQMVLVSVPTTVYGAGAEPFADIQARIGVGATVNHFNVPQLRVGTLDSLMILDEELAKVDVMAEQSINKIQRQYDEITEGDEQESSSLLVKGATPEEYLETFAWDDARFSHSRKLNELVKMIQQSIGKVDDDLKTLGQDYSETKQTLSSLLRKRTANLMVADLSDVLSDEACMEGCGKTPDQIFIESSFLQSVPVVVPTGSKEEFLSTYHQICSDAAALKDGSVFSPVVPGTAFEVMHDDDGYTLFRVSLLKGSKRSKKEADDEEDKAAEGDEVEEKTADAAESGGAQKADAKPRNDFLSLFSDACRQHRYVVKPYTLGNPEDDMGDDDEDDNLDNQIAQVKVERDRQMKYLKRRCLPYFEEVYVSWIHIKAIRVFVESVLRYGVPPQFHSALIVPASAKVMRKIRTSLDKAYCHLDTMDASKLAVSEDVQRMLSGGATTTAEYLPYINVGINFLSK